MGGETTQSEEERGRIRGLHEAGPRCREIARHVGHDHTTSETRASKQRGRPPKLSERDVRRVMRAVASSATSPAEAKPVAKMDVAVRTVSRVLGRIDWLEYSRFEQTLPLTPKHIAAHLEWARRMLLERLIGRGSCSATRSDFLSTGPTAWHTNGATSGSPCEKSCGAKTVVVAS